MSINQRNIEDAVKKILESIGENPEREGLIDTPLRVGKMYEEIFAGLNQDPREQFDVIFSEDHDEAVIVKDIPFYSMCEHHLIPFYGAAHVAYLPKNGKIAGLSKIARAVDVTAKRPQLQERMTNTIADAIMEKLDPYGVLVLIEAEHMCMTMRGIKKPGSKTVTISSRGVYQEDVQLRGEVLHLIRS